MRPGRAQYRQRADRPHDAICFILELAGALILKQTKLTAGEWLTILEPLTPMDRRIVILHVLHGLPFPDVAERLGLAERKQVSLRWQRALIRLRPVATQMLGG